MLLQSLLVTTCRSSVLFVARWPRRFYCPKHSITHSWCVLKLGERAHVCRYMNGADAEPEVRSPLIEL
jgi:hypothetical protein